MQPSWIGQSNPLDNTKSTARCHLCIEGFPDVIFDGDWFCDDCLIGEDSMYRETLEAYMMDMGGVPEDEIHEIKMTIQSVRNTHEFEHFICTYKAEEHHITLEALHRHRIKYASND